MGYRYSRYRPSKVRMMADELPDHKFGFNKRWDFMEHRSDRFLAECTCGWKDPHERWSLNRRVARIHWQEHMAEVLKQQRLPL